jgi:hypothetical protein
MVGPGRFSAGNDEASEMAITTSSGGSRGSRGVEVVVMVDALVALPEPTPESVGSILGATLTRGRRSEMFDGGVAQGPFGKAQLRCYRDVSAGILSLDARPDSGLVATNMDLRKYGPPPPPCVLSPTHLGASEGCYSRGFTSSRGVTIHFQFTHQTERLYMVVVEWAGKRSRSVRATHNAQSDQPTLTSTPT